MIYQEQDQNLRRIIYGLYKFDISCGKQNDFEGRILDSYSKEEKKADFTCDCDDKDIYLLVPPPPPPPTFHTSRDLTNQISSLGYQAVSAFSSNSSN